jgi:xanthine dehydrogenase YagS FAD-binding subunit
MHPFSLSPPKDIEGATAAHAHDPNLAFVAGGTDILGFMKDHAVHPPRLPDINHLAGLNTIEPLPDGGIRMGALARMSDVAADMHVRTSIPMIADSLLFSASVQLRNMASMGGNIMQRTRCAYFRDGDGVPCNKRIAGSGCAARHGVNRNHAIFGWSDGCVATHPSDVAVALSALDSIVRVRSQHGERVIPFSDFHLLPNASQKDNVLGRGDLIVGLEIPYRPEARRSHYLKVRDRQSSGMKKRQPKPTTRRNSCGR